MSHNPHDQKEGKKKKTNGNKLTVKTHAAGKKTQRRDKQPPIPIRQQIQSKIEKDQTR